MKLPVYPTRSALLLVAATALSLLVLGLSAGSALPAAAATRGGSAANCQPGHNGFLGVCIDPVGDVKGARGPDITRVTEGEWGAIFFNVRFAKASQAGSPLGQSATYTDEVSVALTATGTTATGTTATKSYLLTVSATDPKHEVLQRLPNGKRFTLPAGPVSAKTVQLVVNLHPLVGVPSIVRYRVKAVRVMLDGTPGSIDLVPNKGTMVWRGNGQLGA